MRRVSSSLKKVLRYAAVPVYPCRGLFHAPGSEIRWKIRSVATLLTLSGTSPEFVVVELGGSLQPLQENRLLLVRVLRQPGTDSRNGVATWIRSQGEPQPIVLALRLDTVHRLQAPRQESGGDIVQTATLQGRPQLLLPCDQNIEMLRKLDLRAVVHQMRYPERAVPTKGIACRIREMEPNVGRRQVSGIELRQQCAKKIVVRIGDISSMNFLQQPLERRNELLVAPPTMQEHIQRPALNAWPAIVVADDLEQRIGQARKAGAVPQRMQDEKNKRLLPVFHGADRARCL